MNNNNLMNLLEAIKRRKPLIMDLGDEVYLHMNWNGEYYEDEMGITTMNLIQQIVNGRVYIKERKVGLKENERSI